MWLGGSKLTTAPSSITCCMIAAAFFGCRASAKALIMRPYVAASGAIPACRISDSRTCKSTTPYYYCARHSPFRDPMGGSQDTGHDYIQSLVVVNRHSTMLLLCTVQVLSEILREGHRTPSTSDIKVSLSCPSTDTTKHYFCLL